MPKVHQSRVHSGDGKINYAPEGMGQSGAEDSGSGTGGNGSSTNVWDVPVPGGPTNFFVNHEGIEYERVTGLLLTGGGFVAVSQDPKGVVTMTVNAQVPDVRYDLAFSVPGKPLGNVFVMTTPRAFTLPINLSGSVASALANATSDSTYLIYRKEPQKEPEEIGTMIFAAGMSTATFTFPNQVDFNVGDMLYFHIEIDDDTLTDLAVTILATLKP